MDNASSKQISSQLGISLPQVSTVQRFFAEGATIPFVARYRKDATGGLDEEKLAAIRDAGIAIAKYDARYEAICERMRQDGVMTGSLANQLRQADNLAELEAIYAPYKRKRKTRADIAKERGLEPLARRIYDQQTQDLRPSRFIDPGHNVPDADSAISGALDIVAAWIAEHDGLRRQLRGVFAARAIVVSKVKRGKADEGARYRDYFEYHEPAKRIPSHRLLAVLRGEAAGILSLQIRPPLEEALSRIERAVIRSRGAVAKLMQRAAADAWKRLLAPSLESTLRASLKEKAEQKAIAVFAGNLRQLLLVPPAGQRSVLAIDPGFKSGCKAVALDAHGEIQESCVLFLLGDAGQRTAAENLLRLHKTHRFELIAVGSGTGGRECEAFVREQLPDTTCVRVDESGASIYSASAIAREEFPDLDITVRGAISIGRRLQDPLAELIKIDARSIGVGQYQHDVNQGNLKQMLDDTVISCVNHVGVDLNRAGAPLLQYVSGVGPGLAAAIVAHRSEKGPFRTRKDLLSVPRLGPKAFEQAAGFLRIPQSRNPLDRTGVHPENYAAIERLARGQELALDDYASLQELCRKADLRAAADELAAGTRDPRGSWQQTQFDADVRSLGDIMPGMRLPGTVTNITQFGAFVDVGVGQDGLVHISQLADQYVSDPGDVVRLQQAVTVTVLEVDAGRKRISLSLRQ
ncbi:MAG: hypothetical protein ACI8W8_004573 [Rhodothermales bacterium]|jgi:uncharacterized protein